MASSIAASTAGSTTACANSSSVMRRPSGSIVMPSWRASASHTAASPRCAHVLDQLADRRPQPRVEDLVEPAGAQPLTRLLRHVGPPLATHHRHRRHGSGGAGQYRSGNARHRRRRRPVGRRGQGEDHRPARQGAHVRGALPGRAQRRAHRRRRRPALRPPARAERCAVRARRTGDRQRCGRRPADPVPRDRRARVAGDRVRRSAGVEPRPPDLSVAPGPRRDRRGHARRRQDRHDAERHRAGIRRQGAAGRDPCRRGARARIVHARRAGTCRRREHADRAGGWRDDRRRRRRRPLPCARHAFAAVRV